jgi:hypothetical protein
MYITVCPYYDFVAAVHIAFAKVEFSFRGIAGIEVTAEHIISGDHFYPHNVMCIEHGVCNAADLYMDRLAVAGDYRQMFFFVAINTSGSDRLQFFAAAAHTGFFAAAWRGDFDSQQAFGASVQFAGMIFHFF